MIRQQTRYTRTDTLFPDTTLCRSPRRTKYVRPTPISSPPPSFAQSAPTPCAHCCAAPDRCPPPESAGTCPAGSRRWRSEEHTSELQSLMRISYAVFCLITTKNTIHQSLLLVFHHNH